MEFGVFMFSKGLRNGLWARAANMQSISKEDAALLYPIATACYPKAAKGKGEPGILPTRSNLNQVRSLTEGVVDYGRGSIDSLYLSFWGVQNFSEYKEKFQHSTGIDLTKAVIPIIDDMQQSTRTAFWF